MTSIRTDGTLSAVYDLLATETGAKNPRAAWAALIARHPDLATLTTEHRYPGPGQRPTPSVTEAGWATIRAALAEPPTTSTTTSPAGPDNLPEPPTTSLVDDDNLGDNLPEPATTSPDDPTPAPIGTTGRLRTRTPYAVPHDGDEGSPGCRWLGRDETITIVAYEHGQPVVEAADGLRYVLIHDVISAEDFLVDNNNNNPDPTPTHDVEAIARAIIARVREDIDDAWDVVGALRRPVQLIVPTLPEDVREAVAEALDDEADRLQDKLEAEEEVLDDDDDDEDLDDEADEPEDEVEVLAQDLSALSRSANERLQARVEAQAAEIARLISVIDELQGTPEAQRSSVPTSTEVEPTSNNSGPRDPKTLANTWDIRLARYAVDGNVEAERSAKVRITVAYDAAVDGDKAHAEYIYGLLRGRLVADPDRPDAPTIVRRLRDLSEDAGDDDIADMITLLEPFADIRLATWSSTRQLFAALDTLDQAESDVAALESQRAPEPSEDDDEYDDDDDDDDEDEEFNDEDYDEDDYDDLEDDD